jgi:Fic family protein
MSDMVTSGTNIRALDSAYKPFPSFNDWVKDTVVDPVRWERYKAALIERRQSLPPEVFDKARRIATRAAALDTGAIEDLYKTDRGFTFTVAQELASWETLMNEKGENVRPLFEAQLAAYDYVLTLATKTEAISEAAIGALHEQVVQAQTTYRVATAVGVQEQPLPRGQYKALPNHVRTRKGTDHSYAPVDVTPPEMARFVGELRTEDFQNAHPVLQASYAHYAFVAIHPFADGNGRVARALASIFTYRDLSIPIIILEEYKTSYLDALEKADAGNFQAFVTFMLERSLDTIDIVDESIRAALSPSIDQSLSKIKMLYVTKGGYTQDQVDSGAISLIQLVKAALERCFAKYSFEKVQGRVDLQNIGQQPPPSYRFPLQSGNSLTLTVSSAAPATAKISRVYILFLPRDAAGDDDVLLRPLTGGDDFHARIEQLLPTASGMLQIHVNMFVERIVGEMFAELLNLASAQMQK